jgi:hypothetical protein
VTLIRSKAEIGLPRSCQSEPASGTRLPPSCEWVGDKIWLPAQYANMDAELDGEPGLVARARRLSHFLLGVSSRSWKAFLNPICVTLCYLHLAADVGS